MGFGLILTIRDNDQRMDSDSLAGQSWTQGTCFTLSNEMPLLQASDEPAHIRVSARSHSFRLALAESKGMEILTALILRILSCSSGRVSLRF